MTTEATPAIGRNRDFNLLWADRCCRISEGCLGDCVVFFGVAERAALTSVVSDEQLEAAVARNQAREYGTVLACPACTPVRTMLQQRVKTFLELHVNFPDCWDGRRLDSPDHKSHMAYSRDYVCPRSHPVKVPLIRLMVTYPTSGGPGIELASGGQLSGHADLFNGWDERVLARLVETCFHDRPCDPRRVR